MSTTPVRPKAAPSVFAGRGARSLPSRAMAFFSGPVGLGVKFLLLALVNAIALWAGVILAGDEKWIPVVVLVLTTLAIDAIYLAPRRTVPAKFLVPGTIFLIAFQIIPIAYTIQVAFTNYSTGHILAQPEAISAIEDTSRQPPPNGRSYTMTPARDEEGELVLLLVDDSSGKTFVGSEEGLDPLAAGDAEVSPDGYITAAEGYTPITGPALFAIDRQLTALTVPTTGASAIRAEGVDSALELRPTLRYDRSGDRFVRISDGTVFTNNGRGSYVGADGEDLEPGWKTSVGFLNFRRVFNDERVREPFVRVFVWTIAFATFTVVLSFAIGLLLAITLQKRFRFQRFYRTVLVVPYAIPSFLTLLVWAGLLNDEFGVVNRLLPSGLEQPWLFDADWAKVSIILVSIWLTFPYFFLVSLGALQSIPGELVEAARVDGAAAMQVFRRITLPLLLVAVAPLLIASFAFNFNNFNSIYLLTNGGPPASDQSVAGGTDILISYTYKLAFESGKGQDYALASAISMFIFMIVGTISALTFWRSRSLENLA